MRPTPSILSNLTDSAANEAFSSGDDELIALLEGFSTDRLHTIKFEEFPWAEEYLALTNKVEPQRTPAPAASTAPAVTLPEGGGTGVFSGSGDIALYAADSDYTYKLVSAGMVSGSGSRFGVYITPVKGEIVHMTGKTAQGMPMSSIVLRAYAVMADGSVLQANNTNANVNMSDRGKDRVTFLFNTAEQSVSIFVYPIYPSEDMLGGVLIPLCDVTLEKQPSELTWE